MNTRMARGCKWHSRAILGLLGERGASWGRGLAPKMQILLAAGRRDDAIHPQVFHHLSVVIGAMPHDADRQRQTGG